MDVLWVRGKSGESGLLAWEYRNGVGYMPTLGLLYGSLLVQRGYIGPFLLRLALD